MTEDQIKHMVGRFLCWRLPENFNPDNGISFKPTFNEEYMASLGKPPARHDPVGTNLLDATQAEAMVRHMLEGLPVRAPVGPGCGSIDCVNHCGGDFTWETCPNAIAKATGDAK